MKKFSLMGCFFLLAGIANGQIRLEGRFAYGTEVNNLGFGFGGEIFVTDEVSVNPGVIIYFENKDIFDDRDWWEINIDGHYYFAREESLNFYALAGVNITTRAIELGEQRDPDTEVGLNLGVGMNYEWKENLLPFFSIKYIAGNADQAVLSMGMRFTLPVP